MWAEFQSTINLNAEISDAMKLLDDLSIHGIVPAGI